jgi:hypothetical protein
MEKLSVAINNAVLQGEWEPIRISNSGPQLSHLLFADDVLLFIKAKNSQLRYVKSLFDRFSKASGLKINISKSRAFYSSGIPQGKIHSLTTVTGIRSTTSLAKYLGFPMLHGRPKRSDFLFIIERMQTRLASWKNRLLNKTGRLTLATSVLSSIPSYCMQINWLPQNICDSIDQMTRNFIWRGLNNKGIHLVNWRTVTTPKQLGGLGLRTARDTNICLLGKLVWDLVQSTDKLWVRLLSTNTLVVIISFIQRFIAVALLVGPLSSAPKILSNKDMFGALAQVHPPSGSVTGPIMVFLELTYPSSTSTTSTYP